MNLRLLDIALTLVAVAVVTVISELGDTGVTIAAVAVAVLLGVGYFTTGWRLRRRTRS